MIAESNSNIGIDEDKNENKSEDLIKYISYLIGFNYVEWRKIFIIFYRISLKIMILPYRLKFYPLENKRGYII